MFSQVSIEAYLVLPRGGLFLCFRFIFIDSLSDLGHIIFELSLPFFQARNYTLVFLLFWLT